MAKKCSHPGCPRSQWGGGYCASHQYLRPAKKTSEIKDRGLFVRPALVETTGDPEMEKWFDQKMETSERMCQNCGRSLFSLGYQDWRGSQHHPLDKALFPSVRAHSLNHIVLGRWCCHAQFHSSLLNASRMAVFPLVISIVTSLLPLLTDKERSRILEYYQIDQT